MQVEQVVIAGGGLAGLRTAEELRRQGYLGALTLVGAERHPPYDRPPLTKKFMMGQVRDTSLAADFDALGVRALLGEPAAQVRLDDHAGGVVRSGRSELGFDALVVATGADPVRLPGDGRQRTLRTLDDATRLRAALRPGTRLVIVGAGWIGAELATAAAALGCQVTVVEAASAPLAGALGAQVGAATASWYEAAGVELRLGQPVESVEPGGLALPGGGWIAADEIVVAVGVRPAVGWLAGSGIALEGGVATDEGLRASAPGVYAVGDCAAFASRRYGRRLRVEHWDGALHGPTVVAANILGGREAYDPVPYFWSEQFGRTVQYAGHHTSADRLIWRGDPDDPQWTACWLGGQARGAGAADDAGGTGGGPAHGAGERLVAVLTVGRPRDVVQGRRVIAAGGAVDPDRLADPGAAVSAAALSG